MLLLKTLVFTETHASNSRQRKAYEYHQDKQVYKH